MAGAVTAIGVLVCTATLAVGCAAVGAASVYGQRLAGAADAAALAAADAASGAASGVPCERAREVAVAASVAVASCDVDVLVATVRVAGSFAGFPATAVARAGPPPTAPPPPPEE